MQTNRVKFITKDFLRPTQFTEGSLALINKNSPLKNFHSSNQTYIPYEIKTK